MEIFDIGTGELLFIVALAIIFIGPRRMSEVSADIGRWLNKFVRSDTWKALRNVSNEIAHAPTRMMREANLQDLQRELDLNAGMMADDRSSVSSFTTDRRAGEAAGNSILPPGRSQALSAQSPAIPPGGKETNTPDKSEPGTNA